MKAWERLGVIYKYGESPSCKWHLIESLHLGAPKGSQCERSSEEGTAELPGMASKVENQEALSLPSEAKESVLKTNGGPCQVC